MKKLAIIFLLFLSCGRENYPHYTPFTAQLIYDQSHNNVWGLWDHGYCGYSHLAMFLKQYGVIPSVIIRHLDDLTDIVNASGFQQTILMISVAKYQEFDSSEIDAVCNFVKAGGLLFVIAEHDNMYGSSQFLNAVTQKIGITINYGAVGKDNEHIQKLDELNNTAYSKKFGLKDVLHMLSSSLKGMTDSFEVLLRDDETDAVIAAGCTYGKGKMLVIGDSEMFWNGDGKVGIHAGDNTLFFKHCIEWLLQKRLIHTRHEAKTIQCFDRENSIAGIDNSPSGVEHFVKKLQEKVPGFVRDDSINIIVNPKPDCKIPHNKRNIICIEAHQKLLPSTVWGKKLLNLGAVNTRVYSFFMGDSNLEIAPCFVTDGDRNFLDVVIPYNKKSLQFHTLAGIVTNRKNCTLLKIPSSLWGEASHPGLEVLNDGIPLYQPNDYDNVGFLYADKNLLLIGDADAIANQNCNTETFYAIVSIVSQWIKTGNIE